MRFVPVVVALLLVSSSTAEEPARIDDPVFVGRWEPLSKNHVSILGEMSVAADRVSFSRKGETTFRVLRFDRGEYVVEFERDLEGSGRFMRLGPIGKTADTLNVEVAFYETREKALARREPKDRIGGASSWGVYVRPDRSFGG